MLRVLCALGLLVCSSMFLGEAAAQKRIALVIGNSNYMNVRWLPNPVNDANAIVGLLRVAQFDIIDAANNLGAVEMRRLFRDFAEKARTADVAVVYYAGHGIEIDGTNYLLPIDAVLGRDLDVEDEAISLDRVVRTLEPAKQLRLIILDACRDNPFVRTVRRSVESRSIGRGLAKVEPTTSNTLIAYAAKAGSTATDGDSEHSPFTVALLKNLTTPGLDLRIALGRVRDDVMKATGNRQEPFVYGSLGGTTVSLVSEPKVEDASPASAKPAIEARTDIRRDYELALQVGTLQAWDAFLAVHGTGFYADLARGQRAKLLAEEAKLASRAPPSAPNSAPLASSPSEGVSLLSRTLHTTPEADPAEITRQVHTELRRLGCYQGAIDARWAQSSRRALELFNKNAETRFDTKVASLDALGVMRAKTGRVCPLECKRGYRAGDDACVKIVCRPGYSVGKNGECERDREQAERSKSKSAARSIGPEAGSKSTSRRPAGEGSQAQVVCGMNGCLNVGKGCRSELRPSSHGQVAVVHCGGR